MIERKLDWNEVVALKDSLRLLSKLTGITWFGETYNPGYWNLWSIENGQRRRHAKALQTTEARAIVEWKLAEASS